MKKMLYMVVACLVGMAMTGCKDHIPAEEAFPKQVIDFSYEVINGQYKLDYYVGDSLRFYPTVDVTGEVTWDFGDNTAAVVSNGNEEVGHKYIVSGTYKVTARGNGGAKTNVIFIADIRPIVSLVYDPETTTDGYITVGSSYVSLNVELPNPDKLDAVYEWTFPAGTTDENGKEVSNFVQHFKAGSTTPVPGEELGKVKFARVGSQAVQLQVKVQADKENHPDSLRMLDPVVKNVQVALNEEAPTLYYVVKDGTINAFKLASDTNTMAIDPYDMGVSSGQHMLNICYSDGLIYLLDCGKQFVYVNDVDGVLGDGKMQYMSVDASQVGTVITNLGGTAFKDPFYGYIDDENIYFSDRNTGFRKMPKSTRNAVWSADAYPSYVENNWLSYYGNLTSMVYGAFNACFGREDGIWYWCKKENGAGVWRFTEGDIVTGGKSWTAADPHPAAGQLFEGIPTTSYVHDATRGCYYFGFYGEKAQGVYRFEASDIEGSGSPFHPNINGNEAKFNAGRLKFEGNDNKIVPCTDNGAGEGNTQEYIGICQMALDEATGNVYFAYRSTDEANVPSGIYRYNATTTYLEPVVLGVKAFGITLCPIKSKLFN